jgi:hypothetical protein
MSTVPQGGGISGQENEKPEKGLKKRIDGKHRDPVEWWPTIPEGL